MRGRDLLTTSAWGPAIAVVLAAALALGACASDDEVGAEIESPCKAFPAAPAPRYELEPFADVPGVRRIVSATKTYALDDAGKLHLLGAASSIAIDLGANVRSVALSVDGAKLYALRGQAALEVVRYTTTDAGATFDPAGAVTIVLAPAGARPDGGALATDPDGALWAATPDGTESVAQDPASKLGKVLRITNDADVTVFARGLRSPSAIDVDPELRDVWVADTRADGNSAEIDRVLEGRSYGWPVLDGLDCFTPPADCGRDGHVPPIAVVEAATGGAILARGEGVSPLAGKLVFANGDLGALAPFGPSGPAAASKLGVKARAVGRGPGGTILVATETGVSRLRDIAPTAPASLVATGCFDPASPNGVPLGAIAYDVASPLWSDGADKTRFVVIPKGERGRALPDGDLRLPVGTVAVKTFLVDGKKVETRLFVQHELESWVGYSYAWNDAETDAELVIGNRTKALGGGRSWYFPSTDDCNACHTPAAGYTLGLEAKQIAGGAAADALDRRLVAPIDRSLHPPLASARSVDRSVEERARGYLHANCSMCHRDGSATGLAELDLRIDVPLDRTGLCVPPKAGAFGLLDARIVAAGAPEQSVLLHRMTALGSDARMPKLGSHVVDAEGVTVLEQWIRELRACP